MLKRLFLSHCLVLAPWAKKNHLTIDMRAYIWTLNCIPLIYVIPCASAILFWLPSFHSKCWNWEVWIFQLCFLFKLFDLFWTCWVFCILRSAFPFLQRTSWDSDRYCTESIFRKCCYLSNIKFSDPFIWILNVFQECFVVTRI